MNVRQAQPLVWATHLCVRPVVGDNPFVVVLPDIILDGGIQDPLRYNLAAMVARFNETGRSQVLAKRMPGDLSEYPLSRPKSPWWRKGRWRVSLSLLKTGRTTDPGLHPMAVGHTLSADIWAELERTQPGAWAVSS